jgi:serine/threonine-protein kinase
MLTHYTLVDVGNSPARSAIDVGSLIAETYTIEALIGQGGMGSVFLASHTRLPGKRVAIKFLHIEHSGEDVIARFKREAEIAAQLDHPNIVRVDDYNVTEDGTPYLILEYLEGQSLADRLRDGPLALEQVQSIMRMVGSAVAAAHARGIIHRDLKPQNIFLIPQEIDGQLVEVAKVLDFGISKMRGRDTVKTQESTLLGTPQYMAPEQATGQHTTVDERTDVFALGGIVYEMLTGEPAFKGENIPAVVFQVVYEQPVLPLAQGAPHAPQNVVAAVERAMAKQQDDRFATVSDFVEALTGRPIVQRSSMISMPPRLAKSTTTTTGKRTGQAAFANTVDSGSLDKSSATKLPPTPQPKTVSPHAETMASQDGSTPAAAPPPVQPRSKGLVIGLALAGALGIGVAVFLAMRGDDEKKPEAPVAQVTHDAAPIAPVVDAATPVVELDAAEAPADAAVAVVVDAGTKKPPVGGTVPKAKDDPIAAEDLVKANEAFGAGQWDSARISCNAVTNNAKASPAQRHQALLMRGTIHCLKMNSIGNANGDYRAMKIASYRSELKKRCPQVTD